ncbi:MAG: hypothetical protein ACK5JM_00810 [Rhodoblastus sp.]
MRVRFISFLTAAFLTGFAGVPAARAQTFDAEIDLQNEYTRGARIICGRTGCSDVTRQNRTHQNQTRQNEPYRVQPRPRWRGNYR